MIQGRTRPSLPRQYPWTIIILIINLNQAIMIEEEYFKNVFHTFKIAAFHQIYMESARQDLCKDQHFDPTTAFKAMDSFRHQKVIPYELYSFFELHRIESTTQQCEQIIKSLNKSQTYMDWQSFEEMTLPKNTVLKNLALTRYSNVKIEVGSYSKLNYVKEHSEHVIALFFEKELNFSRQYLFVRQQFCRKWGGDIFTMLQKLFKRNKTSKAIGFQQFSEISRQYGIYFNSNEFHAMWKRSKDRKQKVQELGHPVFLEFNQIVDLLLVNHFDTKAHYGLERNIPIAKSMQKPQPSYKTSHWKQHQRWERQDKYEQLQKLSQPQTKKYDIKYRFSYPELILGQHLQTRDKINELSQKVDEMSDRQLYMAYHKVSAKRTIFRQ